MLNSAIHKCSDDLFCLSQWHLLYALRVNCIDKIIIDNVNGIGWFDASWAAWVTRLKQARIIHWIDCIGQTRDYAFAYVAFGFASIPCSLKNRTLKLVWCYECRILSYAKYTINNKHPMLTCRSMCISTFQLELSCDTSIYSHQTNWIIHECQHIGFIIQNMRLSFESPWFLWKIWFSELFLSFCICLGFCNSDGNFITWWYEIRQKQYRKCTIV